MNVLHIQMMYFLYCFIYFLLHSMLGKNCTVQIFAVKYINIHSLYIYIYMRIAKLIEFCVLNDQEVLTQFKFE